MKIAVFVTALLLCSTLAHAADGVQILPDATRILVNKDVNGERWAITLDLGQETPLNVTGNVTRAGGGPPAFLWCAIVDVSGSPDDIRNAVFEWACFGSDRCASPPCGGDDQWRFIATINLPGRFFLP